jgi:transcriptional regulator with XRE-family HTH domain
MPSTEDPAFYEALGRAIKVARTEQGLSRKELAQRAEVSYPYVADIETGRGRPSSTALLQIAKALGMAPSELLARAEAFAERFLEPAPEPAAPPVAAAAAAPASSWFRSRRVAEPAAGSAVLADEAPPPAEREELHRLIDELPQRDLSLVIELARRLQSGGS